MKTVFELVEENGLTLHGDIEHFAEVVVAENSAVLNKEIDRLKQQIRYQDQRDGRIGTHSPTCYSFGPHHYECALRKILDLESERRPWVGLTDEEALDCAGWSVSNIARNAEAKLKEKNNAT